MKRRTLGLILGFGTLALVALILVVVLLLDLFLGSTPPPPGPSSALPPRASERPKTQPADCPDILVLSIPGTWESKADDDPYQPNSNPRSLMLRVTSALQKRFSDSQVEVYTVPYVAQFRNPTVLTDRQRDYDYSRAQGKRRAADKLAKTNEHCPLTSYILMGFSQGAVIAGDLASDIGNGRGPIPEQDQDLVLGVGLIADGRREPGKQHDAGPNPNGVGAEIALSGVGGLVGGITMTGSRDGGFGTLVDRTYSICAPGDLICDSPTAANPLDAVGKLAGAINNPVHAKYASKQYWSTGGSSATQWMYAWAVNLIDRALA